MKKIKLNNFSSVRNFEHAVNDTNVLINAIYAHIVGMKQFLDLTKAQSQPKWKKMKKLLVIHDEQLNQLFEMGFINLFANFESFSFTFTKELLKKYPYRLKSEKVIKFEEIVDFKTCREIKDYFIDSLAIQKTYNLNEWLEYMEKVHEINIFKKKEELDSFMLLNSFRNVLLHSGGKTNSKFRVEMKKFIKSTVPLNQKIDLDRARYYEILYNTLKNMLVHIKTSLST